MYFENILTMTTMASIIKSGCRYRFTILHVKGKKKRQRTQIYSDMREGTVQSIENSIQHTSRGLIDHKSSHSNFFVCFILDNKSYSNKSSFRQI